MNIVQLKYYFKSGLLWSLSILLVSLSFTACKKEYQKFPYTDIVSVSVKDAKGETLKGSVENEDILFYWPVGQEVPEFITPAIILPEGARVEPASGAKVEFKESTTFKVTAQDGSSKIYRLKPVISNLIPYISVIEGFKVYKDKVFVVKNGVMTIKGDYFNTEKDNTKVFFIGDDNKETPATVSNVTGLILTVTPLNTGNYKAVKLVSNGKSVVWEKKFEVIEDPLPKVSLQAFDLNKTISRTGTFTVTGNKLKTITKVEFIYTSTRVSYSVPVKEASDTALVLQMSADMPLGKYYIVRFTFAGNDYTDGYAQRFFLETEEQQVNIVP